MNKPLLVCVDDPSHRVTERAPAMRAIRALSNAYELELRSASDKWDYSRALKDVWKNGRTLVNIEHDMQVTDDMVAALLACPHPRCAWAYWLSPVTTGLRKPILSASANAEYFAVDAAPGFCKIVPAVRWGQFPLSDYKLVEYNIWRLAGNPWHIHYPPTVHYHGFQNGQKGT